MKTLGILARMMFWAILHTLALGLCEIEVNYSDGLHIKLHRASIWGKRKKP